MLLSSELRLRPLQLLPIEYNIDLLIVEAQRPRNRRDLRRRIPIPPYQIPIHLPVQHDIIVLRLTLVRAPRPRAAPVENGRVHGGWRQVVPRWQQRLDEVEAVRGLGKDVAVEVDLNGAGRGEDINALGWVFGVDVNGGVFFVPLVWWGEVSWGASYRTKNRDPGVV